MYLHSERLWIDQEMVTEERFRALYLRGVA